MVDGNLKGIRFSSKASVVTCAVPLNYGTSSPPVSQEAPVDLDPAFALEKKHGGDLRIFPMDLRLDEATGCTLVGTSRSVAVVGLGATLGDAHDLSLLGVKALGSQFRHREDVGNPADVARSRKHLREVRARVR
jgi:phosphoribosylamine-glycine ligase